MTLYGTIDTSIEVTNPGSSWTPRMDSGAYRGSRFGLRGYEQLSADTRLLFDLESGFSSADGTFATANTIFNRQAWIGLGAPWGELRMGRQYSPIYIPFKGGLDAFGAGTIASGLNNLSKITPYTDNGITYLSPDFHGFTTTLMVALRDSGDGNGLSRQLRDIRLSQRAVSHFLRASADARRQPACVRISAACRIASARRRPSCRTSMAMAERRAITTTVFRSRCAMQ